MRYESLDTASDIQNCIATYQNDPVGMLNCIRTAMNNPPVTPGNVPVIDDNTLVCLRAIFNSYRGTLDPTGKMQLPYQSVISMINEVRTCVGLPPIKTPETMNCIMSNCMPLIIPGQPPSDITTCVKNCVSQHQY